MREKLTELISAARFDVERICNERFDCDDCPAAVHEGECKAGYIADHLIANGVTIQKWIPVAERLPEEGADVLGYMSDEYESRIFPANYANGVWFDCFFDVCLSSVTHWMPLPEPPKEVNGND